MTVGRAEPAGDSSHVDAIPIYCGVLALLILVLVICVIVQTRRRRIKLQQARKAELALRAGSPTRDTLIPGPGSKAGGPRATPQAGDAGVYTEQDCRPCMYIITDL